MINKIETTVIKFTTDNGTLHVDFDTMYENFNNQLFEIQTQVGEYNERRKQNKL